MITPKKLLLYKMGAELKLLKIKLERMEQAKKEEEKKGGK